MKDVILMATDGLDGKVPDRFNGRDLLRLTSAVTLGAIMASCVPIKSPDPVTNTESSPTPQTEFTPTPEIGMFSGTLVEAAPAVADDFWKKATESNQLGPEISAGLTKQDVGTFAIKAKSGNLEREVDVGWFTEPTTRQERLFVQNQNGNWIEHVKNVLGDTVQWISPGGEIAQSVPFAVTPAAPNEVAVVPEVTFFYTFHQNGTIRAQFYPSKSIFGDNFLPGLASDTNIPLDTAPNVAGGKLVSFMETSKIPDVKFNVCTPENFHFCPITVEQLFNGEYLNWLYTLSKPFDPAKVKNVPLALYDKQIYYDITTSPHFKDPSTEPFRRDVTAGYVTYNGSNSLVMPIELYDMNHPNQNQWIIVTYPLLQNGYENSLDEALKYDITTWRKDMKITVIRADDKTSDTDQSVDPLVALTFANVPDMADRINRFTNSNKLDAAGQDMTALSAPGIVLGSFIANLSAGWFR